MNKLSACDLIAFLPSADLPRAKKFYKGIIGLRLTAEDSNTLVFEANGTMLRIFHYDDIISGHYTALGWAVPDLDPLVADLASKGIQFERYSGFDQDENGVWTAPDGARTVWFKDLDGNILSMTQFC